MSAKKPLPFLVKVAILTALTTIIWIVLDVYRAFTIEPPPVVPSEILAPITPTLDATVLDRLQKRLYLNEDEIGDTILISPEGAELPGPTEAPTEEAAPEEEVAANETATEEGATNE